MEDVEAIERVYANELFVPEAHIDASHERFFERVYTRFEAAKARRASFLARDANNIFEPRTFTCLADVSQMRLRIRQLQESREQTPTPTFNSFNSAPETFDSNENTPQSGNSHSELTPEFFRVRLVHF